MSQISEQTRIAISIFLKHIVNHSYDGVINGIRRLLEEGPSGRAKQLKRTEIFEWYESLDKTDRLVVLDIIEESVRIAIFSCLVVLDNKASGPPLDQSSDFGLFLQTYDSDIDRMNYSPSSQTRLNLSYTAGGELHDDFLEFIKTRD